MFNIDTGLIFWTILSFVILLISLYLVVFPPLHKVFEQRRKAIEGKIEMAKKMQADAEELLKKYRDDIAAAESKTAALFEEAERKSSALRDDTMNAARKEAMRIIENTKKDIDLYQQKSLAGYKANIAQIVVSVVKKLVNKSIDAKEQAALIDEAIGELKNNAVRKI